MTTIVRVWPGEFKRRSALSPAPRKLWPHSRKNFFLLLSSSSEQRMLLQLTLSRSPLQRAQVSPHPECPALKGRSITRRARLLKQAPRTVRCPDQATAASWIIRERVGIRSQVLTQSPVAHHNHIEIVRLRSFSIPNLEMKFQSRLSGRRSLRATILLFQAVKGFSQLSLFFPIGRPIALLQELLTTLVVLFGSSH